MYAMSASRDASINYMSLASVVVTALMGTRHA
jgi:hypothetical protein